VRGEEQNRAEKVKSRLNIHIIAPVHPGISENTFLLRFIRICFGFITRQTHLITEHIFKYPFIYLL
jgi:hypothetical protein